MGTREYFVMSDDWMNEICVLRNLRALSEGNVAKYFATVLLPSRC